MDKLLIICFFLTVPTAFAQTASPRGEVFGSVGGGRAYDDEGNIGSGIDFGGGVGFRITPKFGIEGQVNRMIYERGFSSGVLFKGSAVFTTANVIYHFSKEQAQPYVIAGVGFVHHENRSQFPVEPFTIKGSTNGFAFDFGAGIRIFINKQFSLRPEFRVFIGDAAGSGVESPFSVMRGSLAFSYHW